MVTELMGYDRAHLENGVSQGSAEEASEIMRLILRKLNRANSWDHRAQVKKDELHEEMLRDDSKDDFLPELLPFHNHPSFINAPASMKKKILSCGWLAYKFE